MPNRNFDGIKKNAHAFAPKVQAQAFKQHQPIVKIVAMGDIRFPVILKPALEIKKAAIAAPKVLRKEPVLKTVQTYSKKLNSPLVVRTVYKRFFLPVVIFVFIILSFAGGMSFALRTPKIVAEDGSDVPAPAGIVAALATVPSSNISNEVIFNTPIDKLSSFYQGPAAPDQLTVRQVLLKQFLVDRNSPLAGDASVIAEQSHWKLILAIAFAESTLGKKCYMFNCSGIGGSSIKTYSSYSEWIADFNHLLEKRYNDWTLKEMCGVYVKPCTDNWLSATQQILDDLNARKID